MNWLLWGLCFVGHVGLWCVVFNRVHATAFPRKTRKRSEKLVLAAVSGPFLVVVATIFWNRQYAFEAYTTSPLSWIYLYGCVVLGIYFIARWVMRKLFVRPPRGQKDYRQIRHRVGPEISESVYQGRLARLLGRVPGNQADQLAIDSMTLRMDIPEELAGLKICQLSDLHFTGQITREYFQFVVQQANAFEPDLIVITGDLVDEAHCLDWLDSTIGRLAAPMGVYYVLGNHDLRINDEDGLRGRLERLGVKQAAGQWCDLEVNGCLLRLTGNELPWFDVTRRLPAEPSSTADLKILISHSPDQIDWARPYDFDLMFAGHTHGGQIAFPVIGPIVAPSKFGVLFASGTFQVGRMIMHVSRGLSGDEPIRIGSLPELGCFTLARNETPTDDS